MSSRESPERVVEALDRLRRLAQHRVAERADGHDHGRRSVIASAHRCGSASTRVTTSRAGERAHRPPERRDPAGSSASKHTVCSPERRDEQRRSASSAASSPRASARAGDAEHRRADREPGLGAAPRLVARGTDRGCPRTSACTAGSFGVRVCTIARPSGRAHADRLHPRRERPLARARAPAAARRGRRPGSPRGRARRGPRSRTSSGPPDEDLAVGRAAAARRSAPSRRTGTPATRARPTPPRAPARRARIPKSSAPQRAHRPGASQTTQRTAPSSDRSSPPHAAHAAGSPQDRQTARDAVARAAARTGTPGAPPAARAPAAAPDPPGPGVTTSTGGQRRAGRRHVGQARAPRPPSDGQSARSTHDGARSTPARASATSRTW